MLTASTADAVARRVRRLADTLNGLRERVRAAVATEAGKAVADAVRDVLTAALAGPVVVADPHPPYRPPARDRWHDDRRGWDDDDDPVEQDDGDDDERDQLGLTSRDPASASWPAAAGVIGAAARGRAGRRLPAWAAVGVIAHAAAAEHRGEDALKRAKSEGGRNHVTLKGGTAQSRTP